MALARSLLALLLLMVVPLASARQVSEGIYSQTWASPVAGQCSECEVRIRKVTPHIVEITGSNGWSGFAYYVPSEDRYQGTFEWWAGQGSPNGHALFTLELKYDGRTLTMNNAKSEPLKFVAIYKKARLEPREIAL